MRSLVLLLIAAFLVACDSEPGAVTATSEVTATAEATPSNTPRVTYLPERTPRATPPPTPTQPPVVPVGHPPGTETGIADVDAVVTAFVGGESEALRDLVRYRSEPCVQVGQGNDYGPPPFCPEGVPTGTPLEFIGSSGCHGGYISPRDDGWSARSRGVPQLFGVVRVDGWMDARAEYLVLFSIAGPSGVSGGNWGTIYEVGDGGIVAVDSGCGWSPEFMWQRIAHNEVILAPPVDDLYGYPPEERFEDPVLQNVAMAVFYSNANPNLERLVSWLEEGCVPFEADYLGPPPTCPTGVQTGTVMRTIATDGCHFGLRTPDHVRGEYLPDTGGAPRVFGIIEVDGWFDDDRGRAAMVFQRHPDDGELEGEGFALIVSDGGIVGFDSGCGETAAQLWAGYAEQGGAVILPPFRAP